MANRNLPVTVPRGVPARFGPAPLLREAPRTETEEHRRALPEYWPIVAMFSFFPLWWVLGIANIALPALSVPLVVQLLRRRQLRVPRGFGVWLLFLAWVALTATQLEQFSHYVAYGWRFSLWAAALVVLVYIADTPRSQLPDRVVLGSLLVLWATTVIGGYLGLVAPSVRLWTPAQLFVPKSFATAEFIRTMIAPRFAQVQDFLGYPLARPAAPFTYTNSWGANLALLTPVVAAAWPLLRGNRRIIVGMLAAASLVPMIMSVNRGLWVTLTGVALYVAVRTAQRRDPRAARRLAALGVLVILLIAFTPLGAAVEGRLESEHSNNARQTVASQAWEEVRRSPWVGYGSPRDNPLNPTLPPIGSHGTLWYVLFCHGIPGFLLFMGAMVSLILRTARPRTRRYLWLHGVVVGGLIMIPFYELLPVPIFTLCAAAGLVLRDCRSEEPLPA